MDNDIKDFRDYFISQTSLTFSNLEYFQKQINNYYKNQSIKKQIRFPNFNRTLTLDNNLDLNDSGSLVDVLNNRRSTRNYSTSKEIELDELNYIIKHACGTYDRLTNVHMLNFPSAGALYNCIVYLFVDKVNGLEKGIYLYNHLEDTFHLIMQGESFAYLPYISINAKELRESGFIIYIAIKTDEYIGKYGKRGLKFALLEAGHLSQNLLLLSTDLGFRIFINGGYLDDKINLLLDGSKDTLLIANQVAIYK